MACMFVFVCFKIFKNFKTQPYKQPVMDETVRLGPYIFGKTLGIGSFSKVKMAFHEPTGRKVAVKMINRQRLNDNKMYKKAYREIKILRLLNHPHIIKLYEVIESPTDLFVIMEYVSGGELFEFIVNNGKLTEKVARRFFQQIVSGVLYCHTHMVVHRDLKPENLLLDENLNVKIADFGLSAVMKDGFFLKTSCGSPYYAAPEVISGDFYAGQEVDVWSCGVILYALLCGCVPFEDSNIRALFKKIKSGVYCTPEDMSEGASHLISRILEVNPIKRITLEEILNDPWFAEDLPPSLSFCSKLKDNLPAGGNIEDSDLSQELKQEISEMGYDTTRLKEALSMGPDLLTRSFKDDNKTKPGDNFSELRQMVVAYHLLSDRIRYSELEDLDTTSPAGDEQKRRKDKSFNDEMNDTRTLLSAQKNNSLTKKALETHWSLGISLKEDSHRVMEKVFRSLKFLKMEWKVINGYRIKARYYERPRASDKDVNSRCVKIGLQLYRNPMQFSSMFMSKTMEDLMQASNNSVWNRYTLDVQNLEGDLFLFLNLCDRLQSLLRESAILC